MFDTSKMFSDPHVNESMLRAAVLIGLEHELSDDGRLNYRDDDANRFGDPGERVLDEMFDSEWIALGGSNPNSIDRPSSIN
jgi:hypothetical protein